MPPEAVEIQVCDRKFMVDPKHAPLLKALAQYAFKDTKQVYSNGMVVVPFFRIVDMLDMADQNYQYHEAAS